jgi:signal peptidase I
VDVVVLLVCAGVLVQAFALEPFQVPTGSMAPALLGHHRACVCPSCGMAVVVGRTAADRDGQGGARCYARASCPNCGEQPLPLADEPEAAGDHVLVNKTAFAFRRPRRWEAVVFRLLGIMFVKRIIGLPGEAVLVRDGDIIIDGRLARKTFAQARAMRVPVFAQGCRPAAGWGERWEWQPTGSPGEAAELWLDGRDGRQTLTHRSGPPAEGKCPPIRDEYAYNGGLHAGSEPVHDFLIEADVEVDAGQGTLALRLCDGQDWVEVVLPAGRSGRVKTRSWPADDPSLIRERATGPAGVALPAGRNCRVEMAFVDRRVSLYLDGRALVERVDLPEPGPRPGVGRPVQIEAAGVAASVRNFALYRDIHYSGRGSRAVGGEPVRLGAEQYFVLGDNSPNSEDSRFWPADAVTADQLLGPAFLVYLPSRPLRWQGAGRLWQCQLPDLARIRWLH